jgi:hypothetical protein
VRTNTQRPHSVILYWGSAAVAWEALSALFLGPYLLERCLPTSCWEPLALYAVPFTFFPGLLGWRTARATQDLTRAARVGAFATGGIASLALAILLFLDLGGRPSLWLRAFAAWGPLFLLGFPLALLCFHAGAWLARRIRPQTDPLVEQAKASADAEKAEIEAEAAEAQATGDVA